MRLRRSPLGFWALALALSLASGLTVSRLVGEAARRAQRLGGLVDVPVTTRSVDAGRPPRPGDVAVRRLPAAVLPAGRPAHRPEGRVTLVPLVRGEVVLAARLAPDGLRGVAALVPPGHRALAVPAEPGGLSLRPGDRVDVLATFDLAAGGTQGGEGEGGEGEGGEAEEAPTFPVATAALVVDVTGEAVTVAVPPAQAPRVAFALARGTVTLALTVP